MTTKTLAISEREAAAYFFELFDANLIPMSTWKYDGTLSSANQAFLNLLGYSQRELEEGTINWRALTPAGYEEVDEHCTYELKTRGHAAPFIKEYLHKDGSRVRVQISNFILDKTDDHGLCIALPV